MPLRFRYAMARWMLSVEMAMCPWLPRPGVFVNSKPVPAKIELVPSLGTKEKSFVMVSTSAFAFFSSGLVQAEVRELEAERQDDGLAREPRDLVELPGAEIIVSLAIQVPPTANTFLNAR